MNFKKLIIFEIIGFVLFFGIRNSVLGISFLLTVISLLFLFALVFTVCFIPFKNSLILAFCRVLRVILSVCFVFGVISFCIIQHNITAGSYDDTDPQNEFAIVLGAGVYGSTPSATLVSRIEKAYEFLTDYPQSKVILSGGQGKNEDISEAQAMRDYLINKGISPDRMYLEQKSSSTEQNIKYSLEILETLTEQRPIEITIISNDFHLYRAKKLAQNAGMKPKAIGTPVPNVGLVPLSCRVREYFSIMFMYAKNGFKG